MPIPLNCIEPNPNRERKRSLFFVGKGSPTHFTYIHVCLYIKHSMPLLLRQESFRPFFGHFFVQVHQCFVPARQSAGVFAADIQVNFFNILDNSVGSWRGKNKLQ